MYVTYEEYKELGYIAAREENFTRYEAQAEAIVRCFTFDRISDADLHPDESAGEEEKRIAQMNKHGVCQLIDACISTQPGVEGSADAPVKSFTNEGYSETYESTAERQSAFKSLVLTCINSFFTAEQRYRGV